MTSTANAQANQTDANNQLKEIVVYADQNKSLSSVKSVTQDQMQKSPSNNGNISDYLYDNVHVRYEKSNQDGLQRGEIKPENISINGADANQTAYFVDNININNDLGVDSSVFDGAIQTVPGITSTQAYFFDAKMLSKVEVQDSDISASLGGFLGGAVIAKTKQYSGKDGVQLSYRTTNSSWAKMRADSSASSILAQVRPDASGVALLQPDYEKHFFSVMAEKSLGDKAGMVIGYSRRYSTIGQYRLIGVGEQANFDKENHQRLSENFLTNFNFSPDENNRFELGLRYSNYKELKYFANNINNNVKDYHQAYGATLAWIRAFDNGVWTNTLAVDEFCDKRQSASANVSTISVVNDDFDPLYDYEQGGYGNSKLTQRNIHFSTEYAFNPFDLLKTHHSISLGGIYQGTTYRFNRPQDVNSHIVTQDTTGIVFADIASTTRKGTIRTSYQNAVLYGEDLIKWKNLEFRPGLRVERDDYLKNTNISPRFVMHYHPWQETILNFGLNRYYGRSFASFKLANQILRLNDDNSRKDSASLKTPHSDELSLGLQQNWQNLTFKLNYIHRRNKDRIVLKRDEQDRKKYYANGSDFSVDVYSLEVENQQPWQFGKTYWNSSFGFDWLHTKRADLGLDYDLQEPVYLDGKLMTRAEMQRKVNSNTEDWILRMGLDMQIPDYSLTWSNKLYWKAPIKGYNDVDGNFADNISRYRSFDYGKDFKWDTSIRWQPAIMGSNHSIYLQLDILNVLNKTRKSAYRSISSSSEYAIYTPGREYWLEVGYQF
ncbi:MAG: TonB-dependent receptor plug domain-containing protein [Pasteurellaceae bacterium]|nr:TonB-dependent receptor plug domain-containing protein [Pasteurellaceae bacterium]